jgi:hypothetical protein
MDIISHGLYGGVAFGRRSKWDYIIAFLFGIAPDLLSFGPFVVTGLLFGTLPSRFEPPTADVIPSFVYTSYDLTHSLVVYAVFFGVLWWRGKRHLAKLSLAWPLHILVDIPTHSNAFFPTPFLWPLSAFSINGVSWGHPYIFIPNVITLIVLYAYWYLRNKRREQTIDNTL